MLAAPAAAGSRVRRPTTFRSAMAIAMHVASPVIAAAEKIEIRPRHAHVDAVVPAAAHPSQTTR
jgi:hypothetical protein